MEGRGQGQGRINNDVNLPIRTLSGSQCTEQDELGKHAADNEEDC